MLSNNVVVLSDYDGTICPTQMLDFLYQGFSADGMKFARLWEQGKISTQEEILSTFASVTASREEMESAIAGVEIDPMFSDFAGLCRGRGIELAVVSEGLRWYIEFMLARHEIHGLKVYANEIFFTDEGMRFEFPHFHPDCPKRGVCKSKIVQNYRDSAERIIFIGDGISDFEAAEAADLVFATGKLAQYCRENALPAVEFVDFQDLLTKWDRSL